MTTEQRAALIIKEATRIMRAGWAKGWSDAVEQAKDEIQRKSTRANG